MYSKKNLASIGKELITVIQNKILITAKCQHFLIFLLCCFSDYLGDGSICDFKETPSMQGTSPNVPICYLCGVLRYFCNWKVPTRRGEYMSFDSDVITRGASGDVGTF